MKQQNKAGSPKLSKLFGHFSLALLLGSSSLLAGSFEDFKRSQVDAFTKYTDERDSEFKGYLDKQWKAFKVFKGEPLYEKPKPKRVVTTQPQHIKSVGPKVTVAVSKTPKKIEEKIEKKVENEKLVVRNNFIVIQPKKDIEFDFYGSTIGFNIDKKMKSAKFYPTNQKGIGNFFDTVASSEYKFLVVDIKKTAKDLNLNDWGVYLLVNKLSNTLFSKRDNVNLFSWFLFNKLGYAVKVGLANKHIVLMHYSKKTIYSTPNYRFNNKKYYVVANYAKGSVGSLYSYKQNYPNATKPLDLSLKTLPNFAKNKRTKLLSFEQFGKTYNIEFDYNQNLIDFMATYPQADYDTYFNSPLDEATYDQLARSLKKYVDGKQASSGINFVLTFVQKAFKYEVDDLQFGREKVMFAQETLYFNKSDCEDRAILFAYLVKKIFKIAVVGVKYSDHMATALYIPIKGDTVRAKGRKFVVADPTYINANIGQSMPKYRRVKPDDFILVK